ncbi:transposase domain-containing protein [Mycolicibacterium vaccae]|uniref:transposase domain-containing protein n=1 Tax=Mycolicibacterium vaccae TaxID=1810 RepID=UPI003CE7093E
MSSIRDRMALAALVGAVPPGTVDAVLQETGAVAERVRALPPWVTTYHVLASAMCPLAGYDDITELLWTSLPDATGRRLSKERPTKGAVTRARARLGTDPLVGLLRHGVREVLGEPGKSAFDLHRFEKSGARLWWIADSDTGALRGCDVRGAGLDGAVELVRAVGATRVTAHVSAEVGAALRERLGVEVTTVASPAADGALWQGMRARSRTAWEQEALARACVSVAAERALERARDADDTL